MSSTSSSSRRNKESEQYREREARRPVHGQHGSAAVSQRPREAEKLQPAQQQVLQRLEQSALPASKANANAGPSPSAATSSIPLSSVPSNLSSTAGAPSVSSSTHTPQQRHQQPVAQQQTHISVESPLPPAVQRCLGDRSYEKRKNAALEVEALVKSLSESQNLPVISSVISVLSKDFCTSMNSNYRKGGLIGIAATAIGLMPHNTRHYLDALLPPVLHCFDDPESRVRYYACESLYNIAKVARVTILRYFNQVFDGLTKLFADVDLDVKNGANLLDRLIKDIVTESETFHVEEFLPLLQNYIRRTNPYIRQLLVGWITVLDSVPDISMIDYLPDFLDGLFNMLSDSNREIRQAADSALSEFLREVRLSTVVEFGPIVSILVLQCHSKERLNRLTAITWLAELIHHPYSGGDALLPYHADVLGSIMRCISDGEAEIRKVSEKTNFDLLTLVRDTGGMFELKPLLDTLTTELMGKDDVPTKMAALRWINMLMEKRKNDMNAFISDLLPVLLRTLSDQSDAVVLLNVQVLSRISLSPSPTNHRKDEGDGLGQKDNDSQFQMVLNAILGLFASDRRLLETRGTLIVLKLCVLLNAKCVYICMADSLSAYDFDPSRSRDDNDANNNNNSAAFTLEFVATMVQTLNLILLTAAELHGLRALLAEGFVKRLDFGFDDPLFKSSRPIPSTLSSEDSNEGAKVFASLFNCWCHNPVAVFSLCLLARSYDIAFALVKRFSEIEVTVGFLMQIDKLVQLLESPIFVHLRLQLLDVEASHHVHLLKSCYGLLMLLPQSDAFRSLNDRLATVCNLRDNLGISPSITASPSSATTAAAVIQQPDCCSSVSNSGLDATALLARFDMVTDMHRKARELTQQQVLQQQQQPQPQTTTKYDSYGNATTQGITNYTTMPASGQQQAPGTVDMPGISNSTTSRIGGWSSSGGVNSAEIRNAREGRT